mgnify:CR=1 FL=1
MSVATLNDNAWRGLDAGQFYQEHYARLRHYFLMQLGDTSEANDCTQETLRYFFFFMEDRCWAREAQHIPVYLMRLAGSVCTSRLAERGARRKKRHGLQKARGLFGKLRNEVARPLGDWKGLGRLVLGARGGDGRARAKHLPFWVRVPATCV